MAAKGKKLSDLERKKIVADSASGLSNVDVAKMNNVSEGTVRNVLKSSAEFARLYEQKKEENTRDVVQQLYDRSNKVLQIVENGLESLLDPEKFNRASAQSIATTIGILIDKYTGLSQLVNGKTGAGSELLQSLHDLEARRRDDGD